MEAELVSFLFPRSRVTETRLRRQAGRFRSISKVSIYSLDELRRISSEAEIGSALRSRKGFGYYYWKPRVILDALEKIQPGGLLVYLDAGSHLNVFGEQRFKEYLQFCAKSEFGLLAFQTRFPEHQWTKESVFRHFAVDQDSQVRSSGQVQAGFLVIKNAEPARRLLREWNQVFLEHPELADDSVSAFTNSQAFSSNRHDQSILSVLYKKEGLPMYPAIEQEWISGKNTLLQELRMPVQHRRLIPEPSSIIRRFFRGFAKQRLDAHYLRAKSLLTVSRRSPTS